MTADVDQAQRSGPHSTNVQIFQNGLTAAETRALVLDVVQAELYRYQQQAEATVRARHEKIADEVLAMIATKGGVGATAFTDPDIQYNAATVGREYARTGDDDLGNVLVGLLGDRIDAEPRTLLVVVLNDAIQTAGRLTDRELDALSLIWRLTRTFWSGLTSIDALRTFAADALVPFQLPKGDASYQHLEALGCISLQPLSETTYAAALLHAYPGVFSRGFAREDIPEPLQPFADGHLFTQALRDPTRLQINAVSTASLDEMLAADDLSPHAEAVKALEASHRMTADEITTELITLAPALGEQIQLWNTTEATHARPTAVGIAIAHANYRRVTGLTTPLSEWIS